IWLIGALVYYTVEKFSLTDSVYFAATTLTTVGFGDLHPKTTVGKLFTIAYCFFGIGAVFYVLTQAGKYYIDERFESFKRVRDSRGKIK
ncbi:MAG: potassium channel family protein, partial [Candidatus Micrarchaeota archaeon]